jgi:serine/threonine protein kinase
MAEVWLVRDRELDEELVAKILPPGTGEDRLALLRRECRQARRLVHPNIVRVFDFHRGDGYAFVTMEHVEGTTLDAFRGRPLVEVVQAVLPIADALAYAHGLGVIHRDLKTTNVVWDPSGRPRLLDFGIAGLLDPGTDPVKLTGGGTPRRASPQQLAGEDPSPADDLYGLGALIHELVTGLPPSSGPPSDPVDGAAMPERLRTLIARMLAESPDARPPGMAAVQTELAAVREELRGVPATDPPASQIRLTPPPRVQRAHAIDSAEGRPGPQRPPTARWVATGAAVVALALGVAFVFLWLPRWAERFHPEPARAEPRRVEVVAEPTGTPPGEEEAPPRPAEEPAPGVGTEPDPSTEPPLAAGRREPEPPVSGDGPGAAGSRAVDPAFASVMSEALEAIEREDWPAARDALARAGAIRPEAPAVADALARVDHAEKLVAISAYRESAIRFESEERWADAVNAYTSVLALDPTIRFALRGKERCTARADLDRRLEFHLDHPERLSENRVLEEARLLLDEASATEPAGPRLRDQIRRLAARLEAASIPMRVRIESDNLTEVTVYRVGRLGTFFSHELELRPGTYTVVGSRKGFRDVRHELVVVAGEDPEPLVVQCEEEI